MCMHSPICWLANIRMFHCHVMQVLQSLGKPLLTSYFYPACCLIHCRIKWRTSIFYPTIVASINLPAKYDDCVVTSLKPTADTVFNAIIWSYHCFMFRIASQFEHPNILFNFSLSQYSSFWVTAHWHQIIPHLRVFEKCFSPSWRII